MPSPQFTSQWARVLNAKESSRRVPGYHLPRGLLFFFFLTYAFLLGAFWPSDLDGCMFLCLTFFPSELLNFVPLSSPITDDVEKPLGLNFSECTAEEFLSSVT